LLNKPSVTETTFPALVPDGVEGAGLVLWAGSLLSASFGFLRFA